MFLVLFFFFFKHLIFLSGHNKSNFFLKPLKRGVNRQKRLEKIWATAEFRLPFCSPPHIQTQQPFPPSVPGVLHPLLKHQFSRLQHRCCDGCHFCLIPHCGTACCLKFFLAFMWQLIVQEAQKHAFQIDVCVRTRILDTISIFQPNIFMVKHLEMLQSILK